MTYGAFKFITRPAPGNHEFYDEHGETGVAGYGYFSYFNGFQHNADGTHDDGYRTRANNPCDTGGYLSPNPCRMRMDRRGTSSSRADSETHVPAGGPVGVGDGWYSYNLGSWHLISLNIECETQPGGCSDTGSWFAAELAWLKKDLDGESFRVHTRLLAPAHVQRLPTASAEEGITAQAFWQLLYEYGADLVLNGHDHLYARYRPLDPSGNYDPKKGIREFIVGTGGETLDPVVTTTVTSGTAETNMEDPTGNPNFNAENLEAGTGEFWGVMALTLDPNGYKWDFESALKDPAQPTGGATLQRQGRRHLPRRSSRAGNRPVRLRRVSLTFRSVRVPPSREIAKGDLLLQRSQFLLVAFPHSRTCARNSRFSSSHEEHCPCHYQRSKGQDNRQR